MKTIYTFTVDEIEQILLKHRGIDAESIDYDAEYLCHVIQKMSGEVREVIALEITVYE